MLPLLRPYQRSAILAAHESFAAGNARVLVSMPTGSGKALTLCTFLKEALELWPDQRIVMLVFQRELVEQNLKTLFRIWPDAPVSLYSAGLNSRDLSGQIVFGSVQSLYRKAYDLQKVDLVVIDEAHMVPPSGDGMYRKFLDDLAKINDGPVPLFGLTASPFRLSSGSLIEGEGRVFDSLAYEVNIRELIDQGYLAPPVTKATRMELDTKGVATRNGEFVASALQSAVDRDELVEAACDEIMRQGQDRRCWLAFCAGVAHARHVRDVLVRRGVAAETVSGETPRGERDAIIKAYKNGRLRCLTNADLLTVGFDHPPIDLIALLRPTKSAGLFLQMVGRGTRLAEDKEDLLVLDFARLVEEHGPIDLITGKVKLGKGEAPSKTCPDCESKLPASAAECPDCGYQFPAKEPERRVHEAAASGGPILSSQVSDWLAVTRVSYAEHRKPGSRATLREDHQCGLNRYSSWHCFDHDGYARDKARRWWNERAGTEAPGSVAEAVERQAELRTPTAIRVRPDGRFWRVVQVRFA